MNSTIILAIMAFLLVVLPLVAGTILGWVSVVRIHRSEGRLYGLGFALFAALLLPFLVLDGLIIILIVYSGLLFGAHVTPLTVVVLGVPLCGLIDFWIVRALLVAFGKSTREGAMEADDSTVKTMSKDSPANKPGPFRRFWWLFFVMPPVCLLLGLAFGGLWFLLSPKQYEARAMVEIRQEISGTSETNEIALSPGDPEWITRLNAMPVLDRVMGELDLARVWSLDEAQARQSLVAMATFPAFPGTKLRELRIRYTDPSEAAAIANAWAQALKISCEEHHPSASIRVLEAAATPERPFSPRFKDVIFLYGPIGLFISPLLTVLLIQILHRGTRWLTRAIIITAGLIVVSVLIVYSYVWIARYFAFSNASPVIVESAVAPPVVIPAGPESVARSFMEAIRDGDIDAAMNWIDPKIGGKEPWKSIRPTVLEELKKISEELRKEAYVGNLNRLTEFTEWYPDPRKVDSPYLAVRVAAPTGGPEDAVKRGLYLILSSTQEGWRVAHFGEAGSGKSLSEHVKERIENEKGVRIEYQASDQPETGKNDPEATGASKGRFPPEGAEIRRFVLDLPVQPPVAVPKDSPLSIDQIKEVLKGVTWGELLTTLGNDSQGDILVTPRPSPEGDRYEITFPYGTGRMRMDLAVDWKFRSAEPSRLRPVGMPDKILADASEFLPQLAIRYAMLSGHQAAAPAADQAKAQARQSQDLKTLKRYGMALAIYRESVGSYPEDFESLLNGDFAGKKLWEGLKKDGRLQNHQTGRMERPIYHGSQDLRERDHDGSTFILIAAPSVDAQGKRLVSFLDGSVKIIDESEYQKQIAEQAKADSTRSELLVFEEQKMTGVLRKSLKSPSPYNLELDGATGSMFLRGEVLKDIPEMLTALSGRKVTPDPYIDRIVQYGAEAVPLLIAKYNEAAHEKRWALVACLCRLPTPESRKFLIGLIQGHADRQSTSYAIQHYPISHEDEIVGILIETLPVEYHELDASERLRKMIFREPALAGELVAALVDEKSAVPKNRKIHDILAHVSGYANAWPNRTSDGRITPESENGFWRQWWKRNKNKEIFDWLIEALYRDGGGRRSYALQILGTLDDKRAIPHFVSALGDDVFGVRYWAVVGLKKMAGTYPERGYTSETFKKEEAGVIAEVKALVGKVPKDGFAMPLIADEILPGSTQVCFMLAETDEPVFALYPKDMKVPEREVPIQVSGRVQVVTSKAPQAGEEKIYMRYRQTVIIVDSWGGIE